MKYTIKKFIILAGKFLKVVFNPIKKLVVTAHFHAELIDYE